MISLMLNCKIDKGFTYFMRKHYDYPDLPSGYQRTSVPIGYEGELNGVRIREIHMEEDPTNTNLTEVLLILTVPEFL